MNPIPTTVRITRTKPVRITDDLEIGGEAVVLLAGPCSVEDEATTRAAAEAVSRLGGHVLRGGAFKPRTSPFAFQGLGLEGLKILRAAADEFGLAVITEALGVEHLDAVCAHADIIQIGSRNMQHFPLLWAVGELDKPVLLKRGFMATVTEWLLAAEHIASRGNERIILCERGIRTFGTETRNTLDTSAIALAKLEAPWPVIGDPSHATGRVDLVIPAARAAIAAGADGVLVEVHPDPANALSDGQQSLPLEMLPELVEDVSRVAAAVGRVYR
jgi:3-deoxy-7-phosphoheptulonate synthase